MSNEAYKYTSLIRNSKKETSLLKMSEIVKIFLKGFAQINTSNKVLYVNTVLGRRAGSA